MRRPRITGRIRAVLFVLVLAPVTAEYLIGYDDTLTNPAALIFGVLFFGPLYGAPAVLIREVARRTGRGWSAILLLGCAFGLIQAGLIDQSLFDPSYRDISFWPSLREPTFLAPLGTSAFMLVSFVGGHVFGSIAAPIGLAEACWPRLRDRPWLGWRGSALMGVLWLLGALFVLGDQLGSTSFRISPAEVGWTVVAVGVLIALALCRPGRTGRRGPRPTGAPAVVRPAPAAWIVLASTAVLLTPRSIAPGTWAGTLLTVAGVAVWVALVARWSNRTGWSGRHVLAAVAGDLLSIGAPAFVIEPLGHPNLAAKLSANVILLGGVLLLAWVGWRRVGRYEASPASGAVGTGGPVATSLRL